MFKSENLILFLLISCCLVISLVLVDALMDPVLLFRTAHARFSGSSEPASAEVYMPDLIENQTGELPGEESETLQDGWNTFRSEGFGFEIQFPKQVVKKTVLNQDALNAGAGLKTKAPVWQFQLSDSSLYQGTNLVEASIVIHVLEGADQEAACSAFKQGSVYQTPSAQRDSLIETEINGSTFWKDEVVEGVMGEFYHQVSYRTFANSACYEITQLLHYQNMDSIMDENIVEFDLAVVLSELDQVIKTFKFLDVKPTFPEQSYPQPKVLSSAVSKAASGDVDGLDVSHWQGTINWPKVANAGYVFTFAKGTEGVGWTDVKFHENLINGHNAGVMMGIYHFARPDLGNSARDEANHFLEVTGDYLKSGYLRPVLDLEVGSSLGKTALSNWVLEWMQTVENRTGIAPLIYTNPNFINYYLNSSVTEYDLWVAHWTCEPEPSYYYPNTGKWSDWAFWQYYGPGGCGGNAGYVPGIKTNIDLNIFNGVESGLQQYDALSKLWVSLTSDAYYYPAPYYADITGNVNGDTTGLIDYAFWWNCTALESDLSAVESSCGVLPQPPSGECEYNEVGMRCIEVADEKQLAEHTYQELGNYTAKVIVDRGNEPTVEDRYKISTYNPIRKVMVDPNSPSIGVIDAPFTLNAAVTLHTSVEGVLQVTVKEEVSGEKVTSSCLPVVGDNESTENFELSWAYSLPLQKNYEVWTRYRPWGSCPVADDHPHDQVKYYQVYWLDEKALLEITDEAGAGILDGSIVDVGTVDPVQALVLNIELSNPSTINAYQITGIDFENINNVTNLQFDQTVPMDVDPEGLLPLAISYELESSGDFSFDIVLDHDASNPTPFRFTVQGRGQLSGNPIQQIAVLPLSPGEALFGDPYSLQVDIDLDPPVDGVLQVSIEDPEGGQVADGVCQSVIGGEPAAYGSDFSWTNAEAGLGEYQIWARYRENGVCPIADLSDSDVSQNYQVNWLEDSPVLNLLTADGAALQDGAVDALGDLEPYQLVELTYMVENISTTTAFQITDVNFTGVVNLAGLEAGVQLPLEVGPDESVTLPIQFEILDPGQFSAQISLVHDAANVSPYGIGITGDGVLQADPVQSLSPQPLSPGEILINENFSLQVAAEVDAPVEGALQISVSEPDGSAVQEPFCEVIAEPGTGLYTYDLDWSRTEPGLRDYEIFAAYYSRDTCPPAGDPIGWLAADYQVNWQEEPPRLEVLNPGGTILPDGEILSLGQYEYNQSVNLSYQFHNLSTTTPLEITDIRIENITNLDGVDWQLDLPVILDPEQTVMFDLSFLVNSTGNFSFDLAIDHNGSNASPYLITLQGSGVMTDNPLKYIVPTPTSPGSSLIGVPYSLDVEVGVDLPDQGALQLSMIDAASGTVSDSTCQTLVDNLDQARTFALVLNQNQSGERDYTLIAQYRAQGTCPIEDASDSDLSESYKILWEEETPSLEVLLEDGTRLPEMVIDDLDQVEFYDLVQLTYQLNNTSSTSKLDISALDVENLINIDEVEITPSGSFSLEPNQVQEITLSFRVTSVGPFSLDLKVFHTGENASPYRITAAGSAIMSVNPIRSLNVNPTSPASAVVGEAYALDLVAEVDAPAAGIMLVSLSHEDTSEAMGQTCLEVLGGHSSVDVDLNWSESIPDMYTYEIEISYQAFSSCPFEGPADAKYSEIYQVSWSTIEPELIVNRPEGVTIFDGAVDYIGVHDFFRFVEVTYLISNETETDPLLINSITPENLQNLREVIVSPAGEIVIDPGESQEIKISFQVLTLDSYSFNLVWDHNGSNPSPYTTGVMGESLLNLGDAPQESWLYRFLESLIRSGFFLKLPIVGLILVRRKDNKI